MPMKTCQSKGCYNSVIKKETYKVLDENFHMYSFKVELCDKCYEKVHEMKEKLIGDYSVFFNQPINKNYY